MPAELAHEPPSPPGAGRRLLNGLLPRTSPPESATPDGARGSDEPTGAAPSSAIAATPDTVEAGEESTPEATVKRWAGKYATPEAAEKAWLHAQSEIGRLRKEVGDRRALQRELGRLQDQLGEERQARAEVELYLDALLNASGVLPQVPAAVLPEELTAEQKAKVVDALRAVLPMKETHA